MPGQQSVTGLFFGYHLVPFYCEINSNKVVILKVMNDSIARAINAKQGDVMVKIGGKDSKEVIDHRSKIISSSDEKQAPMHGSIK